MSVTGIHWRFFLNGLVEPRTRVSNKYAAATQPFSRLPWLLRSAAAYAAGVMALLWQLGLV
jgi:hypothetical protein